MLNETNVYVLKRTSIRITFSSYEKSVFLSVYELICNISISRHHFDCTVLQWSLVDSRGFAWRVGVGNDVVTKFFSLSSIQNNL